MCQNKVAWTLSSVSHFTADPAVCSKAHWCKQKLNKTHKQTNKETNKRNQSFALLVGKPLVTCWKLLFWQIFFKNFGCVFSRSNTILATSEEWLVRLTWNENEMHWLDTGYNMWPSPLTSLMTLTLNVSRSNFEIALSRELLVWLMWNEKEVNWYDTGPILWPCPLTTPMTLTLEFQGQSLN